MKKKGKNIFVTILLIGLAALLGYYVVNGVMDHLPEKEETPAEEGYVLHFEGGPIDELDISEYYEEGMKWSAFASVDSNTDPYCISVTGSINVLETNTMKYWTIQLDGENVSHDSVIDLGVTYTLIPNN